MIKILIYSLWLFSFLVLNYNCKYGNKNTSSTSIENVNEEPKIIKFDWKAYGRFDFAPIESTQIPKEGLEKMIFIVNNFVIHKSSLPVNDLGETNFKTTQKFWQDRKWFFCISDIESSFNKVTYYSEWLDDGLACSQNPLTDNEGRFLNSYAKIDYQINPSKDSIVIEKESFGTSNYDCNVPRNNSKKVTFENLLRFRDHQIVSSDMKPHTIVRHDSIEYDDGVIYIFDKEGYITKEVYDRPNLSTWKTSTLVNRNNKKQITSINRIGSDENMSLTQNLTYDSKGCLVGIENKSLKGRNDNEKYEYKFLKNYNGWVGIQVIKTNKPLQGWDKYENKIIFFDEKFNWVLIKKSYPSERYIYRLIEYSS
jgi:hypothetical protein